MSRQSICDDEVFFENFRSSRSSPVSFNDCVETPIPLSILSDLKGKAILAIGCGMRPNIRLK